MRLGLPRADRADDLAGSDQQSWRSNSRLLYRLADLGERDGRHRTDRRIELLRQLEAFRLAIIRGSTRHHTGQ